MALSNPKKRKLDDLANIKPPKKSRRQQCHSGPSASPSENKGDFPGVDLADSHAATDFSPVHSPPATSPVANNARSPSIPDSDPDSDSDTSAPSNTNETKIPRQKSKRNDPDAFASSMSAILGSKLSTSKRSDPVLARSATAAEANASILDFKLETKARQKLRLEKKEALERGRVRDVLGTECGATQAVVEEEKRLRKIAQRGIVKLFNAVRQAQVRGEEARKEASKSVVGRGRMEEKVGEMSRVGFLEMVAAGGKGAQIEEG